MKQKLTHFFHPSLLRAILFAALIAAAALSPAYANVLDIKEITSKSGVKAWLVEDHSVPVIALSFTFLNAGSKQDSADKQGLSQMASNTMDEGAGELDSTAFQGELNNKSISLRFSSGRDDFGGRLKTLSRHKDRAFELLKLSLSAPRFDEEAIARMRQSNQSRIRSSLSDPDWIAARVTNDIIYKGHPYALNAGGTLSTLENITAQDLHHFVKTRLARENLRIGVAGDITADELTEILDTIFSELPEKPEDLKDIDDIQIRNAGEIVLFKKDIPQTILRYVQNGIDRHDPDYQAAQVLNYILGGAGFGSRLTEELREKNGLTYGIYSYFDAMDHANSFTIQSSTQNINATVFEGLVKQTTRDFIRDGITDTELQDAKSYLLGSLPLSLSSTDKIANFLVSLQQNDRPINYLDIREKAMNALTKDDIQNVAARIIAPKNWTLIYIGQPQTIKPTITLETLPNVE